MDQGPGIRPELIKLALFGSPIKASLSPRIHKLFAAQFGFEIEFQSIETQAKDFPGRLEEFRLAGGIGCNVTLPLKRDAWRLATDSSAQVSQAQAANTLVYQPASGWFAHNTDGTGLVADLTGNHGIELAGQRLLILGAGGAAAGILGDLLAGDPQEVMLVNRNLERARVLAGRFAHAGRLSVAGWLALAKQGSFNLIINATSLGHHGQAPLLVPSVFAPGAVCYDLNYSNAGLPLKKLCEQMNRPYIDGMGMLVEQAAKGYRIWTGKQPDSRVVIDACRRDIG